MLKSEVVSRIQRRLGMRTDLAAAILEELQDAQVKFERGIQLPSGGIFLPWFLRSEQAEALTEINEQRVPVPSDFLREIDDEVGLWYYNADADTEDEQWTRLEKNGLDFLRVNLPGTGSPKGYCLDGVYFRIFPTPDAVYSLKMIYYAADATLTDADGTNKWLTYAPYLFIGEAGYEIAASTRDDKAVAYFEKLRMQEIQRLWATTEARSQDERMLTMGGDD